MSKKYPLAAKKAEQTHLPGMEPVTIPEVEEAAKAFAEAKEYQSDAAEIAKNAEEVLIGKMKENGIRAYNRNGLIVVVEDTTHAKVKESQKPKRDERNPNPKE
jgi:hypothetical protein